MFNTERTFGVEIEFVGDAYSVKEAVNQLGIECEVEGYNHATRNHWKIVTDASVRPTGRQTGRGLEIVSPILRGIEGLEQLKRVCQGLENAGAKVNRTCGLHVHHDAQDFTTEAFKNIIKIYQRFEPVIDTLVSNSRRENNNTYCASVNNRYFAYALEGATARDVIDRTCGRYRKLNLQSFVTHGTVEFRQHQGTMEFEKIANWIKLTQAMVERAVTRGVRNGRLNDWNAFTDYLFRNHAAGQRVTSFDDETKAMLKYFNKRRKALAA